MTKTKESYVSRSPLTSVTIHTHVQLCDQSNACVHTRRQRVTGRQGDRETVEEGRREREKEGEIEREQCSVTVLQRTAACTATRTATCAATRTSTHTATHTATQPLDSKCHYPDHQNITHPIILISRTHHLNITNSIM